MDTAEPGPRTAAAVAARHAHAARLLRDVEQALHRLRRENTPITVRGLARQASVSRTFLYENPQARQLVNDATAASTTQSLVDAHAGRHPDRRDAVWRERALNAEDALACAHREILQQRHLTADLMGQVRDLEQTWTHEGLQRLVTENTSLKQRLRHLTEDNQNLTDKLAAARSNARFLDRRIADLEVRLLDSLPGDRPPAAETVAAPSTRDRHGHGHGAPS